MLTAVHADRRASWAIAGAVVGLGKGVIGLFAKPLSGMAGLASKVPLPFSVALGRPLCSSFTVSKWPLASRWPPEDRPLAS